MRASLPDVVDPAGVIPPSRIRLLIVDDNLALTRYVARLLKGTCEVRAAHDGLEGLQAARQYRPDLVLVDVMMPGMDGFALLRAIRADEDIHTISVMMLSGRSTEEARLEALGAGADDYLVKPFKAREMIARVRSHVEMVKIRRAAVEREGELQRKLGEVQNNLQTVLDGTNDAFISFGHDLRIASLNDAGARLVDADRGELVGRPLTDVSPEISSGNIGKALREAIDQQRVTFVEHFHSHSGRWFSIRCYPTLHGVTAFGADITEKKMAEEVLLHAHAELETRVVERTRELRELYDGLKTIREEERASLSREVHDQLGQLLSAAKIDIKLLELEIQQNDAPLSRCRILGELRSAGCSIEEAIGSVRRIATELRPPELEQHGLGAAIEWHARDFERRTRIKCHVKVFCDVSGAHGEAATALFRIFQEAMTNVLRHAEASQVWVKLHRRGNRIVLHVWDDGVGIFPTQAKSIHSIGLKGMRERAAILRGKLTVGRLQPCGTLVAARIPLE